MSRRTEKDPLALLRRQVYRSLLFSFFLVSLILTVTFDALAVRGYFGQAFLSLLTYGRMNNESLQDDDAPIPERLRFLNEADFASFTVNAGGLVTDLEFSGDNPFLSRAEAEQIAHSGTDEGMTRSIVWQGQTGDWGGFYVAMDLSVIHRSIFRLLCWSALLLLALFFLLRFVSARIARWITKPAEEAFIRQRRFTADCSHELKTPLAAIRANVDLLALKKGDEPEYATIREETENMSNLIGEMLTLAKMDESDLRSSFTDIDLSSLAENCCLVMDALLEEKGQRFETRIEKGIRVQGSKRHLQRLISVFLENATRHAEEGTVIRVGLSAASGRPALSVSNQGAPLSEEQKKHIFDRFYQADASASGPDNFGLGLAIAKSIAESHGADISVESEGGWITFRVIFPPAS